MAGCYGSDVEVELRRMLAGGLGGKSKKLVDPTGVEEGGHWAGLLESRPSLQVNTFLYNWAEKPTAFRSYFISGVRGGTLFAKLLT
jgi:hypothetical protein